MPTNSSQTATENNRYTIVHKPSVERRNRSYLSEELPYRMAAIRDQITEQAMMLAQATADALRLSQPEQQHLIAYPATPSYLAGVAANATLCIDTLRNSARELQYTAFLAGYDTSSLAPIGQEIEEQAEQGAEAYNKFLQMWNALLR